MAFNDRQTLSVDRVIPVALAIINQFNGELRRKVKGFTPEAEEKLRSYSWPGSARQLRDVLECAMIFTRHVYLDAHHLDLCSDPA